MVIIKEYFFKELILKNVNFIGKVYYNSSSNDDFYIFFIKNNVDHRYYGPSIIRFDGYSNFVKSKSWWFNDKYYGSTKYNYNQKQFLKEINNLWLL